jgi:hypothetical protein
LRAAAIHGGVAAAYDDQVVTDGRRVPSLDLFQETDAGQRQSLTGTMQAMRLLRPDSDEYRLVKLSQFGYGEVGATRGVHPEFRAELADGHYHGVQPSWKAVLRDAVAQHTAGL